MGRAVKQTRALGLLELCWNTGRYGSLKKQCVGNSPKLNNYAVSRNFFLVSSTKSNVIVSFIEFSCGNNFQV